jgi:hypothetical protein
MWYSNRLRKTMIERRLEFISLKLGFMKGYSCYSRQYQQQRAADHTGKTDLNSAYYNYNSVNEICQVIFEKKSVCRYFI